MEKRMNAKLRLKLESDARNPFLPFTAAASTLQHSVLVAQSKLNGRGYDKTKASFIAPVRVCIPFRW